MKKRGFMKKLSAALLATAMTVSTFPQFSTPVFAADTTNQLPTVQQFATVGQLKSFNTDDTNDGTKNPAKVYFGANPDTKTVQQWWIAGSQNGNLTLFAASPLATGVQFNSTMNDGTYEEKNVYANHYGASDIKGTVKGLETSYFTSTEQGLMNDTTIHTNDTKNNSVYSTTDKLYLAYGDWDNFRYITVGINGSGNTVQSLNTALRVDMDYWGNSDFYWLRTPDLDTKNGALIVKPGKYVAFTNIIEGGALVPAFELNLSSVIFASAAPAASSGDMTLQDVDGNGAFTLRYKSDTLGSALVSYDKSKVTLTGVSNGTYLVVQNNAGAKAKQITNETEVSASTMGLGSFANCKVWLETTDTTNRMIYATLAEEEQGTTVNITAGTGLLIPSNNGEQEVAPNTAITDITVEVADEYYLTTDYISNLQGQLNGLTATETDDGFTISGTPSSDVNITLPAATVLPKSDTPVVEFKATSTSITATVANYKDDFGDIEYKWNDGNWETDKNTLSNLQADTTYKLAVRFTGNGFYQMSDEYSADITTLKDGSIGFIAPRDITITYKENLKLSNLALPQGWSWVNGDTLLSAGTQSYPATFDTTSLESTTDFSKVDGYDANTHKVTRNVAVKVDKTDSQVSITTQSIDKAYDGNAVIAPEYTTSGSDGKVTIKWQKNTGIKDNPKWEDMKSAPSTVGTYRVVVELVGNHNYNSASAALDFVISKADNAWTEELSITGWTYNEKANTPIAKAQFGDVVFTYSSEENGTYTNEVSKNAGTWYVKATVAGTENYTGLESAPVKFEIAKAIPTYEKVTGLVLGQGQALSNIELPEQFKWVDDTLTADELGMHIFKAVYTPEDTANYLTIEVELEVEVVPTPVALNHVPTISASDKAITVGDKFEPLKNVTAKDKEDGDLTSKIKVINNRVDTKKAGTYEVTYQVTDSQGAAVTKTIKVTVKAASVNPDKNKPSNDKESVETGDQTNVGLFTSLSIISALGIAVFVVLKKKKALEHK